MHFNFGSQPLPLCKVPDSATGRNYWIYFLENAEIICFLILFPQLLDVVEST